VLLLYRAAAYVPRIIERAAAMALERACHKSKVCNPCMQEASNKISINWAHHKMAHLKPPATEEIAF